MSVKLIVEFKGKRQAISVPPMAPLQKLVETFCFQQAPQLDASCCQLYYQKKLLDPTTPVRFANLPKEAKLELVSAQVEQRLGLADKPAAPSSSKLEPASAQAVQPMSGHPASPADMYKPAHTRPPVMQDSQNLSDQPSVSANGISAAAQNAASQGQSSSQSAPAGQSEAKAGATSERRSADASAASSSNSTRPIPAGLDRQIHVFTRDAVAAAEASGRAETNLPADFYDFTPDDYQNVMSGWAKHHSQAAAPLKTQKLREQDERRRAEQFGPVPVRVHFPDGTVIQAEFKPLETLSSLQNLVQQCIQPTLPKWYMYVTPPKQVLKDLTLTFCKAGLLPAANVLIGLDSDYKDTCLRPDIAALQADPPARTVAKQARRADGAGTPKGNVGSGAQFLPSSKSMGEKKVPKWMKLGK